MRQDIQQIEQWNDTEEFISEDFCLHHYIEQQVERTPNAIACIYGDEKLTYSELNVRANKLAHHLLASGITVSESIAVFMQRSLEMLVTLVAVLKAGAAYVPLDVDFPQNRLSQIISNTNLKAIITTNDVKRHIVEDMTKPISIINVDDVSLQLELFPQQNPEINMSSTSLAYIIYTSGSTGNPKGVMIPHIGICNRLLWMQQQYQLTSVDRVLQKTPYTFDVSVWELFWPLMTGATLVIAEPEKHTDTDYIVQTIATNNISIIHFVPSMLGLFLEHPGVSDCKSLRDVICSGEALPLTFKELFFENLQCRLHNLYGPTEASIDVTFYECKADDGLDIVPIGKPIANTYIYILDEKLQHASLGETGELYIGGIGLATGYCNQPELTAERFIDDPFDPGKKIYKTGDIARWLHDGNIEFIGRKDFQVQLRGLRIELGEIEVTLLKSDEIKEAVVLLHEDAANNQMLVAYITEKPGMQISDAKLREYLVGYLPQAFIPAKFIRLQQMPLTANGKIDRKILPAYNMGEVVNETIEQQPENAIEKQLLVIWQGLLKKDAISITDNFFEIGGHSLLIPVLQKKITDNFDKQITNVDLFNYTTVQQLAKFLTSDAAVPETSQFQERARNQKKAIERLKKIRGR